MKMLLETILFSTETKRILSQVCEKHRINQVKELVDIYRHKPDLFFEVNGFSKNCWDEISGLLSDPSSPYMPEDSVISFQKALLIVRRNHLVDELAELSKEIRSIR